MSETIQNTIIIKHGSGAPANEMLQPSELGFDTENKKLYIGHEDGVICLNDGAGGNGSPDAVLYIKQVLNDTQKAQARENIGAADIATVEELNNKVEDVVNPFKFSLSVSPSTAEAGQDIESAVFTWSLTRVPATIFLDEEIEIIEKTGTLTLNSGNRNYFPIREYKRWTTKATDEKGKEITPESQPSINFTLPLYYGAVNQKAVNDVATGSDEDFENLIKTSILDKKIFKKLTSGVSLQFVPQAEGDEVAFYALPSGRKKPIFSANGFDGGFLLLKTNVKIKNDYDKEEEYNIWISENVGLKTTTINVR